MDTHGLFVERIDMWALFAVSGSAKVLFVAIGGWYAHTCRDRGAILMVSAAFGLTALADGLFVVQGVFPRWATLVLPGFFLTGGLALFHEATRRVLGLGRQWQDAVAPLAVATTTLTLAYFTWGEASMAGRMVVYSAMAAVITATMVARFLPHARQRPPIAIIVMSAGVVFAGAVVRLPTLITAGAAAAEIVHLVTGVLYQIGVVGIASGSLLLLYEQKRARSVERARQSEVFYREIHHRVKNNLAVVQSYVDLSRDAIVRAQASARGEETPEEGTLEEEGASRAADRVLASAQSMIATVASIHDLLHRDPSVDEARLDRFIDALATSVVHTFRRPDVDLVTDLEPVVVAEFDRLFASGLLVNELVTNAMKHAFPDRGGTVRVALRTESFPGQSRSGPSGSTPTSSGSASSGGQHVILEVSDDGVGPAEGPREEEGGGRGFGTDLIRLQVDTLNGTLHRTYEDGLTVRISFPAVSAAPHPEGERRHLKGVADPEE